MLKGSDSMNESCDVTSTHSNTNYVVKTEQGISDTGEKRVMHREHDTSEIIHNSKWFNQLQSPTQWPLRASV